MLKETPQDNPKLQCNYHPHIKLLDPSLLTSILNHSIGGYSVSLSPCLVAKQRRLSNNIYSIINFNFDVYVLILL